VLGELHGIPLLVKDSIATEPALGMHCSAARRAVISPADLGNSIPGMRTTAGSVALLNSVPARDATAIRNLRARGAIILGKANMTEFGDFKGDIPRGWSAVGGQTRSAYKATGCPGGSSSGSAVGVSAGFAPGAIGTEADGSITLPSGRAAAYGLKASVGLISRTGMVPLASSIISVGPIAKSAYDVAVLLGAMVGSDDEDPASELSVEGDLIRI
jgi:amidase